MSSLRAENIMKELGAGRTKVLDDVNLTIDQGEFVSLVGKSGSGKSTLLYLLSSLDWPTGGRVLFGDQDLRELSDKELYRTRNHKIGFVFQFHYLLPELTALENVLMPARKAGLYKEKKPLALEIIDKMGLSDRLGNKPNQLSGGQAQRVAIARALIMQPQFLFADEPTGALDSKSAQDVMRLLKLASHELHTTVVMVTHDAELSASADREIRLADGRVIAS